MRKFIAIRIYEYDIIVLFLFSKINIIYHYLDQYNVPDISSNLEYDLHEIDFFLSSKNLGEMSMIKFHLHDYLFFLDYHRF